MRSEILKTVEFFQFRDVEIGRPEIMVNFVTSSYQPELLSPIVEKIATIPEVVSKHV